MDIYDLLLYAVYGVGLSFVGYITYKLVKL